MKKVILRCLPLVDLLLLPLVYPAAWLLRMLRQVGLQRLPRSKNALMNMGVFPIRNHYYEPQFDHRNPDPDFSEDRNLPGIDWNEPGQLKMLETFCFAQELAQIPPEKQGPLEFYLNNGSFLSGDAEYWYQIIRAVKPLRIIEVGSGNSTLMAIRALDRNRQEDPAYQCDHICVEPYEQPWLEQTGVTIIRQTVESLDLSFFSQLEQGDILFIDSSHIIRPQGDVLFEYLEILPSLNPGVIVHVHDIFSPKNYLREWLQDTVKFWNEQYLLEAFMTNNGSWEIVGALNFLHHKHFEKLHSVAPFLTRDREPGSFYIRKTGGNC